MTANVCYEYKISRNKYKTQYVFFSTSQGNRKILLFQVINTLPIIIDTLKNIKIYKNEIINCVTPGHQLYIPAYFDHNYYTQDSNEKITIINFAIPMYFAVNKENNNIFLIENLEKLLTNNSQGIRFNYYSFIPSNIYDKFLENLRSGIFIS